MSNLPATLENVDAFWRQYWRTSNAGEYRDQYETNTMPRDNSRGSSSNPARTEK